MHQAGPRRHGLQWWQFDVSYLVIRTMAMLGLARITLPPFRDACGADFDDARARLRSTPPRMHCLAQLWSTIEPTLVVILKALCRGFVASVT